MHSTEGIVLKKDPYGEANAMVTILTKDFGKIRVMAQGVKKEEAKLKGHLEPLTHTAASFVIGKNMYRATSAEAKNLFTNIRGNLRLLFRASYIANLIDSNTFEEEGDPRLFDLVCGTFELLDAGSTNEGGEEKIIHDFHVHFLDIFGLLPASNRPFEAQTVRSIMERHVSLRYGVNFDIMSMY